MDESALVDGIYIGRYVLVEYDTDSDMGVDRYMPVYRDADKRFYTSYNQEEQTLIKISDTFKSGTIVRVPIGQDDFGQAYNIENPLTDEEELWQCNNSGSQNVIGKIATFTLLSTSTDSNYVKNYAIDTENKSLDLFQGIKANTGETFGNFNKVDLTMADGYAPSNYLALRTEAVNAGAEVVIMDSISHMWNRKGGLLDLVAEAQNQGLDNYRAWGTDKNRKEKELLSDIVRCPEAHIITTVRTKEKFGLEFDETRGKNKVVSISLLILLVSIISSKISLTTEQY